MTFLVANKFVKMKYRIMNRYLVCYLPFVSQYKEGEKWKEWKQRGFESLEDANNFYDSLKIGKGARYKALYDQNKASLIAEEYDQ